MNNKLTFLAFLTVSVLLGVNFIFIKLTNRELPPFAGAAIRFLLASAILYLISVVKKFKRPKGKELTIPAIYGTLTFGLNSGLLYWGLQGTPSEIASVIYSTVPLSTVILSSILKLEKMTLKQVISSLIVIGGIALIFYTQLKLNIEPVRLLAIIAASFFAASSTLLVKKCSNLHSVTLNSTAMLSGSISLILISFLENESVILPKLTSTWLAIIWLTTSSCIAFVLMASVIKNWNPVKASYTSVLIPVVTIAAGILFTNSGINIHTLIGSTIVVAGVGLNLKKI